MGSTRMFTWRERCVQMGCRWATREDRYPPASWPYPGQVVAQPSPCRGDTDEEAEQALLKLLTSSAGSWHE